MEAGAGLSGVTQLSAVCKLAKGVRPGMRCGERREVTSKKKPSSDIALMTAIKGARGKLALQKPDLPRFANKRGDSGNPGRNRIVQLLFQREETRVFFNTSTCRSG